ncbi:MAG TPA: DNA translocase FtsK 4TM domain-containing protein, partial [Candidatus Krumholzibacteria bacterium]|nr:DNA translocase FtsK 4TM domain-containing protein [Candidatus Krumholzibacteria bacterium]
MTDRARIFLTVSMAAVAAFVTVALATTHAGDWPFDRTASLRGVENHTGPFGSALAFAATALFGRALAWVIPILLAFLSVSIARDAETPVRRLVLKGLLAAVLANAFFAVSPLSRDVPALRGELGDLIASGLASVFGEVGSAIVLIASVLLIVLGEVHRARWLAGAASASASRASGLVGSLREMLARRRSVVNDYVKTAVARSAAGSEPDATAAAEDLGPARAASQAERWVEPSARKAAEPDIAISRPRARAEAKPREKKAAKADTGDRTTPLADASLPPISILVHPQEDGAGFTREELKSWSGVLEEKLTQFGVDGKVTAVHHGPVVTTFEFEPAPGVRIKDIVSRSDDLALAMRARSLRMIAPIPGRACVGIEMPNPRGRTVYLAEVLSEVTEKQRTKGIAIGLGVDVVGQPFLMNLCDAPHLLIAGTTGSGKSVCLNTILTSILLHYRPSDVQLLLVDPKMVEMSQYNGIPHLMHPVITDPKDAARVLEFLVGEMSRRNELFRREGVRNIDSYNVKIALEKSEKKGDDLRERLAYIVLVVDELGDLALAKGVDIESLLTRLAQMARAAGIHMVLATQRPSVDVIVGKTKANFPTRIAFRVATKVDSRTIIDAIGADKLLGKGDMLYMDSHHPQPARLHGAWVSEPEIEQVIAHWKAYR